MNKKVIGIVITLIIVLAAVIGVIYLITNDSLNKSQSNQKPLESTVGENKEENTTIENTIENREAGNTTASNGKILIAFFSRADENYNVGNVSVGNTEIMAGFIKDYFGNKADVFKIEPVVAYPSEYSKCLDVATEEKNNNARPEFKNANSLDISKYDTVFIGYPIWWGDVPMIINTFIEKYNFAGKNIYLFNTHEGSGNAGTYSSLKSKLSSSNVNTNGLALQGRVAREEASRGSVENWLKGLGF